MFIFSNGNIHLIISVMNLIYGNIIFMLLHMAIAICKYVSNAILSGQRLLQLDLTLPIIGYLTPRMCE